MSVCLSVCLSIFSFLYDNLSKGQWIFTKLDACIDVVEICLGLLMGKFRKFLPELSAHDSSIFLFQDDNYSKCQWIFSKLALSIDIVEICFGIANGQISLIFDRVISQ